MNASTLTDKKPRGRPPRISRDAILDTALAMLEQHAAPPSLTGVAKTLGVAPMAIYTYFAGKDELMQGLTERLLADFELVIPPTATPLEKLAVWTQAMRRHFLKHPQLIEILVWEGSNASVGWLRRGVIVAEILEQLGFAGEELGRTTLWIWHVVMGAIQVEIRNRTLPQALATDDFQPLEPALKQHLKNIGQVQAKPDYSSTFFNFQISQMLRVLEVMPQLKRQRRKDDNPSQQELLNLYPD